MHDNVAACSRHLMSSLICIPTMWSLSEHSMTYGTVCYEGMLQIIDCEMCRYRIHRSFTTMINSCETGFSISLIIIDIDKLLIKIFQSIKLSVWAGEWVEHDSDFLKTHVKAMMYIMRNTVTLFRSISIRSCHSVAIDEVFFMFCRHSRQRWQENMHPNVALHG